MADVLVVHHDLMVKGGGEAVCMNVLEEVERHHQTTLFTLNRPNISQLNKYFNTDVQNIEVRMVPGSQIINKLCRVGSDRMELLRVGLMNRVVAQFESEFDLLISTVNEFHTEIPSIQYIHQPQYARWANPADSNGGSLVYSVYDKVCKLISGIDIYKVTNSGGAVVVNSNWVAELVREAYDVPVNVIYPPVPVEDISNRPKPEWSEKENGFVTVSRITPHKRLKEAIELIVKLQKDGYDVHHHVVGPKTDEQYYERIKPLSDKHDFIHIEGKVTNERLVKLLSEHKYGLHATKYEQFGISMAEMVSAGQIPFLHNSGGQREVVGNCTPLLFNSDKEAIEKIARVLSNKSLQNELRKRLQHQAANFDSSQFQDNIRELVESLLSERTKTNS